MSLFGLRIVENANLPIKWRETRVRGGYMNHWLIRSMVPVPDYFVSEAQGIVYVHPLNKQALFDAIKKSTERGAR